VHWQNPTENLQAGSSRSWNKKNKLQRYRCDLKQHYAAAACSVQCPSCHPTNSVRALTRWLTVTLTLWRRLCRPRRTW